MAIMNIGQEYGLWISENNIQECLLMNTTLPARDRFAEMTPRDLRLSIRAGQFNGHTSGVGQQHLQANIVILNKDWADDFLRFCVLNPKPCPVLDVTEPGDPIFRNLGCDVDIRTDLPQYNLYRNGVLEDTLGDITQLWRSDYVAFALGCSFSFEQALLAAHIPLKHVSLQRNIAMYRTNIAAVPAGRMSGKLVVTMRPLKARDAIRAVEITTRFTNAHGSPLHIGNPALIGIADLDRPDYGDPVTVADDEIPVFWACGVTPQAVIAEAKPDICITHAPGHMLVTDILAG